MKRMQGGEQKRHSAFSILCHREGLSATGSDKEGEQMEFSFVVRSVLIAYANNNYGSMRFFSCSPRFFGVLVATLLKHLTLQPFHVVRVVAKRITPA